MYHQFPYSFWSIATHSFITGVNLPIATNLFPFMTSASTPYGTVTSLNTNNPSAAYYTFQSGFYIEEGGTLLFQGGAGQPQSGYLQFQFPTPVIATGYAWEGNGPIGAFPPYCNSSGFLQASNDGANWTGLDGQPMAKASMIYENITSGGPYLYWRMLFTGYKAYWGIWQWALFGSGNPSLIPFMTSNTAPYGNLSGDGITSGQAFFPVSASGGFTGQGQYFSENYNGTNNLIYQFPSAVTASSTYVSANTPGGTLGMSVSDDGINWTGISPPLTAWTVYDNGLFSFAPTTAIYWNISMTFFYDLYYWGLYP